VRALLSLGAALLTLTICVNGQDYYKAASGGTFTGGTVTTPILHPDGTSGAPSIAFASEPTLGFWRSSAGNITAQGTLRSSGAYISGGSIQAGAGFGLIFAGNGIIAPAAVGVFTLENAATTIGSNLKVDALPTIASGFGTSPSITAGSTPLAGSVNVGTGGVAFSGTLNFGGTAFPSAPFCVASNALTSTSVRPGTSTTQLTFTNANSTVWAASDVVTWICISSK
jgi:hypothetical protein